MIKRLRYVILAALPALLITSAAVSAGPMRSESVSSVIAKIVSTIPHRSAGVYQVPTEQQIQDWGIIFRLFRERSFDSCRAMLRRYNYTLDFVKDPSNGAVYEIITERPPIQYGWGSLCYNRNRAKRLYVEINHPLDDPDIVQIGAELFRRMNAEWLLIGGTSRYTTIGKSQADAGKMHRSIFQRWHEILTDLTHVSLSLHSFAEGRYAQPISSSAVVLSNGRTTDEQWGISQLSMTLRDTLRSAGFATGLAMYDSGYARLSGGWNVQGVFTNDSVGFGHWLYVELAGSLRSKPSDWQKFITAMDRGLELTGRRVSHQVNRAFGLVAPRVVKVDSLHGLFFPGSGSETYRIISFNTTNRRDDTTDIRLGNWVKFVNTGKTVASVTRLDSADSDALRGMGRLRSRKVTRLIEEPITILPARGASGQDSSVNDDSDPMMQEPLQVHRIPLQPLIVYNSASGVNDVKYEWKGAIAAGFRPGIPIFQMSGYRPDETSIRSVPSFLIPIINSSYESGEGRFIGIQMTKMLVSEIARLVNEYEVPGRDVGLIAERTSQGGYYLRIFPTAAEDLRAAMLTP